MNASYCVNFIITCSCLTQSNLISDFENFNQIKVVCFNITQGYSHALAFTPSHPIILESLIYGNQVFSDDLDLFFFNLEGINLMHLPLTSDARKVSYTINHSKFNFYINKSLMNYECSDISLFQNTFFLKSLQQLNFIKGNKYKKELCLYIFYGSNITLLLIYDLRHTIFIYNYFTFKKTNNTIDIDSNIYHFSIKNFYYIDIDSSLINHLIFLRTIVLNLRGVINLIENNMFDKFVNLKIFRLELENFDGIVSKNFSIGYFYHHLIR